MGQGGDPAFLSAPAVPRNPVGPVVTGEDALASKADLGSVTNTERDGTSGALSNAALQQVVLQPPFSRPGRGFLGMVVQSASVDACKRRLWLVPESAGRTGRQCRVFL